MTATLCLQNIGMYLQTSINMVMICHMYWKNLVSSILDAGYTQSEIALLIGVKQPSISALANGKTTNPSSSVADALRALHKRVVRRTKVAQ